MTQPSTGSKSLTISPSAGAVKLTRKPNWDTDAFDKFLISRALAPFTWGSNDCALFAADAIEAITGIDVAADFRGLYDNEAAAWKAIAKVCNGTTVEHAAVYCATKFGMIEWEFPRMAKRGDLVVLQNADRVIAGVVHLNGRHLISVGDEGLQRFPITQVKRAWHYE
jgi:hypothetical protein